MENLNNIAVLYGGSSSERDISLQSGEGVSKALIELGFSTSLIDYKDLSSLNLLKNFDFVFIALHGFEGESGILQKNLNDLKIKYTGSSADGCRNSWNKKITKNILKKNNINTPNWIEIENLSNFDLDLGIRHKAFDIFKPFDSIFLKPLEDGSSIDIFKVDKNLDFKKYYLSCSNPNRAFIFEEYIEGREFTVTIVDNKCYPPIEIITQNEFYDYEAKYISNQTILKKADLSKTNLIEIKSLALNAFHTLNCKGWGRVDFLQSKDGDFYVIEVNTVPGMTTHSCVPKSGSYVNLSYNEIVNKIIYASM
tara:strand:- start:887 stop:1813 length:927 start_codon:yes stop_codon:yes gene_type:complete